MNTTVTEVACKRCKRPLHLDTNIDNIKNLDDLNASLYPTRNVRDLLATGAESGFEMILPSEEGEKGPETTSPTERPRKLPSHTTSKIFETFQRNLHLHAVTKTPERPLCAECTEVVMGGLEAQIEELEIENMLYQDYLDRLSQAEAEERDEEDLEILEAELLRLEEEESELRGELLSANNESKKLKGQKLELTAEAKRISALEKTYWERYTEFQNELLFLKEEKQGLEASIKKHSNRLDMLKQTNLYNDAFYIWHDGHFGTINGFRLGTLPTQPVSWPEINAAWGQAMLLLYILAKRLNYKFTKYHLIPMGSYSRIKSLEEQTEYELFGTEDYTITKLIRFGVELISDSSFDKAMVAFLVCVKELASYIESKDKEKRFKLPYRMQDDKIKGISIKKNQYNNDEGWTRSLKYLLTNMKWMLAWVAQHY